MYILSNIKNEQQKSIRFVIYRNTNCKLKYFYLYFLARIDETVNN